MRQDKVRDLILLDKTHPDFEFLKLGPKDSKNQPTVPPSLFLNSYMSPRGLHTSPLWGQYGPNDPSSPLGTGIWSQRDCIQKPCFALKAYGSNCGQIQEDCLDNLRPKS
jgi:hypothetical protein